MSAEDGPSRPPHTPEAPDSALVPGIVYFDHGATSWPKPAAVTEAVRGSLVDLGGNPGRGAYALAMATARMIFESRRACASFLGVPDPHDLVFSSGCTEAMNLVLKGVCAPGDRLVVSSMEHNAVVRPLAVLETLGVRVDVVEADETGLVDADEVEHIVKQAPTRAVVCQHASNVSGTVQPVADLADIAHAAEALLIVDGAQAGGHLHVDLAALGADAYAVSGHKGLLGPQGIGLLYLAPHVQPRELVQGGTGGGQSHSATQPLERPDRYEAGTPNTPGIAGLGAAVRHLAEHAREYRAREARLTRMLHEGLLAIGGFTVLGPEPSEPRVPVLSFHHERVDADQVAFILDRTYGVAVRAGVHCAPWAHRTLGSLEGGAVRMGVGWANTDEQVAYVLEALREIVK